MDNQDQSRFASTLTLLVGAWLLVSPLFISMTGGVLTSTLITGGIIALAGLVQLFWTNPLPSWIAAAAAVWLVISAFVFDMSVGAGWSTVISAVIAFGLAAWDGMESNVAQRQHHVRA